MAVAWFSSGSISIRYVLPIIWIPSHLTIKSHMAMRGDTGAESDVCECLVLNVCAHHLMLWWNYGMHIGCAGPQSTLKSPVVSITEIICAVVS